MMKRLLLLASILCATLSADPKLARDLPTSGPAIDVIVRFKNPPTKNDLKLLGPYGQVKKMLDIINGVHIALTPAQIQALASVPTIAYVSPSRPMKSSLDITTSTVSANLAWNLGWTGAGVGVAVVDSGVALKNDLKAANGLTSRVVYSESFVAGETTADLYGHGTHVAGIIGSGGNDSTGAEYKRTFKGVAPGVNIISLKALDQNGGGTEANVIAAIQTAVSLKSLYNIRVLNLSLGRPVFESYTLDPLCQAVEAAWKSGIVVVVAAGNYGRDNARKTKGYGTIQSPGNDPYVITVGATNSKGTASPFDDAIASFSSKGPTAIDRIVKPDLVAPGNGVVSLLSSTTCTIYQQNPTTRVQDAFYDTTPSGVSQSYLKLSGTSMSTPVVSGAAALLIQKTPSLTPDQVKARLMLTASKILPAYSTATDAFTFASFNNQSDIFTVGAGYLNINAALASTNSVTLPALSPTVVFDTSSKKVTMVRNFTVVWGDSVVWADTVVWGDAIFAGRLLNGLSVVWGDSAVTASDDDGFSVVWGDSTFLLIPLHATDAADSDIEQ